MTDRPYQPVSLLLIGAGFALWASAFALIYAAQAVGCAMDASIVSHRAAMLTIWLAHLAALIALLLYCRRRLANVDAAAFGFTHRLAFWSTLAATVATVWTGFMIPVVTPCL